MHSEGSNPRDVLRHANKTLGLALGEPEIKSFGGSLFNGWSDCQGSHKDRAVHVGPD